MYSNYTVIVGVAGTENLRLCVYIEVLHNATIVNWADLNPIGLFVDYRLSL